MNRFATAARIAHAHTPVPRIVLIPMLAMAAWLAFGVFASFIVPIFAQELATVPAGETTVIVPYGNWLDAVLSNALQIAVAAVLSVVAVVSRRAPTWLAQIIKTLLTEQMLTRAIGFGINATRGAVKGRTLNFDVGSAVLAQTLAYVIDKAPAWLIKFVGGVDNLKDMILARLDLDAEADATTVRDTVQIHADMDGAVIQVGPLTLRTGPIPPLGR